MVSSEDEHDETKLLHNTSQLKNGYILGHESQQIFFEWISNRNHGG